MKILYFHQHFTTRDGASGTRSYEFALQLLRAGHEVTMVCGSFSVGNTGLSGTFHKGLRHGWVDGIDVIELDLQYANEQGFLRRTWVFLRYALASLWLALREPHDLIFCTSTPLTAAIPGIASRWLRDKPFVFEVRDLWPELPREMGVITNPVVLWLMSLLEVSAYKSAHRLIGLSPGIVEGVKARGIPDAKVSLIPNGCDLHLADPVERSRDNALTLVYCGAHGLANGLDAVLLAAEELQKRGSDARFILVGEGSEKPRLMQVAKEKQLSNCEFRPSQPKNELLELLTVSDVGIMCLANVPAFYDGTSPNKFFDFLSSGMAVINNYPGWLAGMIEESQCGLVVAPEDTNAFADAVEQLCADRETCLKMGENARTLANRFDRKLLSGQFTELLEEVHASV